MKVVIKTNIITTEVIKMTPTILIDEAEQDTGRHFSK